MKTVTLTLPLDDFQFLVDNFCYGGGDPEGFPTGDRIAKLLQAKLDSATGGD